MCTPPTRNQYHFVTKIGIQKLLSLGQGHSEGDLRVRGKALTKCHRLPRTVGRGVGVNDVDGLCKKLLERIEQMYAQVAAASGLD